MRHYFIDEEEVTEEEAKRVEAQNKTIIDRPGSYGYFVKRDHITEAIERNDEDCIKSLMARKKNSLNEALESIQFYKSIKDEEKVSTLTGQIQLLRRDIKRLDRRNKE